MAELRPALQAGVRRAQQVDALPSNATPPTLGGLRQLDEEIRRARQHLADLERARRAAIAEAAVQGGRLQEGDLVEFRRDGVGTFQAEVVAIDPLRPRSVKLRYRGAGKCRRPISKPDVWVSPGRISRVLAFAGETASVPALAHHD